MSEAAAEWVPVIELTPWADNPRHNDGAVKAVARSIERFGFATPILARRQNGEVVAGHTRLRAAILLGLELVPVRYIELDADEAHLLALADNKLGEIAAWDEKAVAEILDGYSQTDAALAGWASEDIAELAGKLIAKADAEVDAELLRFRKWKIPLTDEQAERLEGGLARHSEEFGSLFGVVARMLEANDAA